MFELISRRSFSAATTGLVLGSAAHVAAAEDNPKTDLSGTGTKPIEASFDRDYPPPGFKPSWKKPQINRLFVQDFVIYAHSELDMVKKLLDREPALLNATMDWGQGDWESGLGGASHMGRRDIVEYLLAVVRVSSRATGIDQSLGDRVQPGTNTSTNRRRRKSPASW